MQVSENFITIFQGGSLKGISYPGPSMKIKLKLIPYLETGAYSGGGLLNYSFDFPNYV